ncbi:MAG: hypothetical protein QXW97_02490 [Candidatus Pacearchaeota archaeon]
MSISFTNDLERKLHETNALLEQRNRDYQELSIKYSNLFNEIKKIREYINVVEKQINDLRISRKEMLKKASEDRSANASLNEWKNAMSGELYFLRREYEKARKEVEKMKEETRKLSIENIVNISKIFNLSMKLLLTKNPEYSTIPFYYNGVGKSSPIYTRAFCDLFSLILNISEKELSNLSLKQLLNYVEIEKRSHLRNAFFRGERLRNYEFKTTGVNSKKILIGRSYPVFYEYFKKGKMPIGIGLFFIDPENLINDEDVKKRELRKIAKFSRNLLNTLKETADELYIFKKLIIENDNFEESSLYSV